MEFIVIGVGRSGTGFISKLLTQNGIPCGHESIYGITTNFKELQNTIKRTHYKGDSSWLAVPHISKIYKINPNTKFIHIVRNPVDVVKSFLELDLFNDANLNTSPYVKLIGKHVDLKGKSQIERAISYYIGWFKLIDTHNINNKVVLNLENLNYDLLSTTLGHKVTPMNKVVNDKKNKKIKTLKRVDVEKEIKDSPQFLELHKLAKKYGYEL
jgi:hypothetical protein